MDLPSTGTILLEDYLYKWKYKEQDTKLWVYFFFQNNNVGNYESFTTNPTKRYCVVFDRVD